ncbi:cupin domain-containing protein [Aliamphritea hakodatensis]|uniref:cupin domain-containing protein n=1 Tax=Aliamphritea hakodatensis TaxID=2895352 RepID=UPI0022FD9BF6|nr:cupin domain-containing protein [Aliamphritea hakodatensis]
MSNQIVVTQAEDTRARYNVALLGEETAGQLSLRVQEVQPGEGTPLHIHTAQAETFHVISGNFRFRAGNEEITGGPGFTVHIPKNTPHCFLYEGKENNGQLISVLTPGIHDGFILNIPRAQAAGMPTTELTEMAEQFGVEIIGPKLSARD